MQSVLAKLNVNSNGGIIGYVLYIFIALCILTLMLQQKGKTSLQITIFLAIPIMAALIDKIEAISPRDFMIFFVRVMMFVFPLVVAGLTKTDRSRGPAILAGVIALVYLFARWFFEQMPH